MTTRAPATIPAGRTPAQPNRTARPTQHRVPIQIEIVEPAPNQRLVILPGTVATGPSMPSLNLHAKVLIQGQETSIGTLQWEFHLSGTYPLRDGSNQSYLMTAGNTRTAPGEQKAFTLLPADVLGGTLAIRASYTAGPELGGVTVRKTVAGCRVVGRNPERADVIAHIIAQGGDLTWLFLRMFWVESRYRQFETRRTNIDMPLIGPPAGAGIVQRDPEMPEWRWGANRVTDANNFFPHLFWNWKRNIEEGITYFREVKLPMGVADLARLHRNHPTLPEPTAELGYRAGIRRNNGGVEYSASDDGLHYQAPVRTPRDYANEVITAPVPEADAYPVPADTAARVWPALEMPPLPRRRPTR